MRRFRIWASVVLVAAVVLAGVWAVWNFELRWRPKTIDHRQGEIANLLKQAGWVSPGPGARLLYVVCYHGCPDCARLESQLLPDLRAKGVETRVIEVARPDLNGLQRSTPAERATVAQLWLTRDWKLLERWDAAAPETWTAAGIPPAEGIARTAVVESGREFVRRLTPLLRASHIRFAYPTLVWWNAKGQMRGCACQDPRTYRFVRKELGG